MPETAPKKERLLDLVAAMSGQPVAMLVDLVVDRYVTGTPKRISREAPVLILRHQGERAVPGGGGNAVANVLALGGVVTVAGVVGDDPSGQALLDDLRARGARVDGVLIKSGYKTPTKTRILAGARHAIKQQVVRIDVEAPLDLGAEDRVRLLAPFAEGGPFRAAVLSDYGYGAVDPSMLERLRTALGRTCALLGDSRYRLDAFCRLDGATPNLEEAEALLGDTFADDPPALASSAQALRSKLGTRHLLITRGSDGMILAGDDGAALVMVHGTDQVADVTGAGDTVIGTFALATAAGATPLEAACLANYAGGVVVMKRGTATADPGELRAAISADPTPLETLRWVAS